MLGATYTLFVEHLLISYRHIDWTGWEEDRYSGNYETIRFASDRSCAVELKEQVVSQQMCLYRVSSSLCASPFATLMSFV